MRITVLLALIIFTTALKAQTFPGSLVPGSYGAGSAYNAHPADSMMQKKWVLTRYSALSASYSFFKGGHASVVAAPLGLQINRRLTNNVYAFANATIAPAYITFSRSFMPTDFTKPPRNTRPFQSSTLDMYSRASLGLQYINDEKTISVSGSIGVERSSYPLLPYYRTNEQRPIPTTGLNR